MNKCYYCKKETNKGVIIYPSPRGKAIMCIPCKIERLKDLLNNSINLNIILERKIKSVKLEIQTLINK